MKRQELQDRVRRIYESFDLGDLGAYRAAFADGIVWHVPGDNPVSGVYRGAEAQLQRGQDGQECGQVADGAGNTAATRQGAS